MPRDQDFAARGDLRFAAELFQHAVFAELDHPGAKDALAGVLEQLFDALAIRLDGPHRASDSIVIHWNFTDSGDLVRLTLANGALTRRSARRAPSTRTSS